MAAEPFFPETPSLFPDVGLIAVEEADQAPGDPVVDGDRQGQESIRINDQYRICFAWTEIGPDEVEIVDYHKA